jgi:PKD repeat protein
MVRNSLKNNLQIVLSLTAAVAILAVAMRAPAQAFVPFQRDQQAAVWDVATLPNGTINFSISPDAPAMLRDSVLKATAAWSKVTDNVLKFAECPGGIEFSWTSDVAQLPDALYLAFTNFSLGGDFKITGARVVVNGATYDWHCGAPFGVGYAGSNGKRDVDLDGVILHELGHALGLDHSDKNPAALVGENYTTVKPTMNSIIYPGAEYLHTDDIVGMRSLYLHDTTIPEPELSISGSPATGVKTLNVGFAQTLGDATTTWDFGDGHTFTGMAPSHKFTAPGAYTVTATFNGKVSTMTVEVLKKKVKAPKAKKVKAAKNAN